MPDAPTLFTLLTTAFAMLMGMGLIATLTLIVRDKTRARQARRKVAAALREGNLSAAELLNLVSLVPVTEYRGELAHRLMEAIDTASAAVEKTAAGVSSIHAQTAIPPASEDPTVPIVEGSYHDQVRASALKDIDIQWKMQQMLDLMARQGVSQSRALNDVAESVKALVQVTIQHAGATPTDASDASHTAEQEETTTRGIDAASAPGYISHSRTTQNSPTLRRPDMPANREDYDPGQRQT